MVTDAGNVEQSRATIVAAVDQLPDNVASFKTEYAAKSKRRLKDVTKSITSTNDVVDDVNTQVREKGLFCSCVSFFFCCFFLFLPLLVFFRLLLFLRFLFSFFFLFFLAAAGGPEGGDVL